MPLPPFRTNALAGWLVALIVLALLVSIGLVSLTYHVLVLDGRWALTSDWLRQADIPTRASTLGQLGDYFGGTLNPLLTFSTILLLVATLMLQRRQLEDSSRQVAQSTRAIDLEAYVRVNDILQTPEGIAARERLYALTDPGLDRAAFADWTPADRKAAETVCRQFDLVGTLVAGRLFEPGLFLQSWQRTIVRCWAACQGVVQERRARHGDGALWQHFEALEGLAQARGSGPG
jgi:hypothetical protein